MRIDITECNGSSFQTSILFNTLSNYKTIDKIVLDFINDKIDLPFLDIGISYIINGTRYPCYLRQYGHNGDKEELQKHYNRMKKVPSRYRQIPNDTMMINCDCFESELYIHI